ncbi:MAG TPA: RidA family protein [Gaiellaceae bacterium]|nr:RidA family protein [Gaiellaceae bacterium]
MKQAFFADDAPKPGGRYSHAVRAGDTVYLAGQVPHDPATGEQPEGFEEQARQAFRNLEAEARAAGASLADAVRVGVYLRDMGDFVVMNEVFAEFIGEPAPVRTTIQSDLPGFAIEVDAVLYVGR